MRSILAGVRGVREFLQEGIRMENFDNERVMSLIGISFTENHYPMIIAPFMPRGDLLSYLRNPNNVCKLDSFDHSATNSGFTKKSILQP